MRQKLFYNAFNVLYTDVKEKLCIYQKEDFYRLLFEDIYRLAEDELLDNDSIRKITSGNSTVHRRVMKKLCTIDGFEIFRITIEKNYIKNSYNIECVLSKLFQILENNNIPNDTKRCIYQSITDSSDFQISRAIAGILVCTNHSDYISNRGKGDFLNIDFMRLSADQPILQYPRYISDAPDVAVEELIGREDELNKLYDKIVCKEEKLLISAVGGLGKTELVKHFLHKLTKTEVSTSGIEVIAWISYNNNDIRMSIKQALHLHCELDEVWLVLQNIVSEYNNRLLLVIDNIETVTNDEYLRKLDSLKCRMLVTSRQKSILGFTHILKLEPLKIEHCRDLFYKYYKFQEKDSEVVNDIIKLSAKLTIMIVFIAKIAFVEGLTIRKLYLNLVEKGFKLSEEDVSCEHEKLQNDETIIKQMCILFSIARYDDDSKLLLTYISIIPNLKFDFSKAKRWFKTSKNSKLLKLFNMGMLEHTTKERTHIYWMHSVIAAAIREQQKETLYNLSRPFVSILSEELDCEDTYGREYEKAYLIPFSWSVADIMENHWNDEKDTDFLTSLFHVCFACSNYSLCEKLINNIIEIQKDEKTFGYMDLVYSYRNKIDLLLQFDRAEEASVLFDEVERIFKNKKASKDEKSILWSQYGILNQIRGDYQNSRKYFQKCIDNVEKNDIGTIEDVSTAYSNMARMLVDSGDLLEAYSYIKKAIDVKAEDAQDSNQIICYSTLAAICTELVSSGYVQYMDEAKESFKKVIEFREKNLGLHHADTAVVYHDYAYYLYIIEEYDEALTYNEKSNNIYTELFSEYSITKLRSLNTKALIIFEQGKQQDAFEIFEDIIATSEKMSNDYLIDIADFVFNYAQCLHSHSLHQKAIEYYDKCINIWDSMSDKGNIKEALAYKGYAECLYNDNDIPGAIEKYEKATDYITEDFYLMTDILDTLAACYIQNEQRYEGIKTFVKLLEILSDANADDYETKFQLCNNLSYILEPSSKNSELNNMLNKEIEGKIELETYVHNFFIKDKEK